MQAAAELKKLGGRVSTDSEGVVTGVDLALTAVTDADLEHLADCPGLLELNLRGTLVGDEGLASIAAADQIEFLGLTGTMVTDAGLRHLQTLKQLRFLTLGNTAVTDAGVPALGACGQLEGLNLKATSITAAGLVELQARLPNCRIVSDVTATTAIESSDLPLPFNGEPLPSTDVGEPPPPPTSGGFSKPLESFERARPLDPPAFDGAESSTDPAATGNDDQFLRRPVASGGPSERLDAVLSDGLNDPTVLRAIAHSYSSRGEWDAASTVLRVALQLAPDNPDLQFELGVAEARSGDYVSALMHLQQCGSTAVAHYNLGILMHEAGLEDASTLAFRSALKHDPNLIPARVWLSQTAPQQAKAAAAENGSTPSMADGPVITPVEGRASTTDGQGRRTTIQAQRSSLRSVFGRRTAR